MEQGVHRSEWASLGLMAALVVGMSIGFPFISQGVVVPYLQQVANDILVPTPAAWATNNLAAIDFDNLLIMAIIVAVVLCAFAVFFWRGRRRSAPIYLAGVGLDFEKRTYRNSLSQEDSATQRNWYMSNWFSERLLTPVANTMCIAALLFGIVFALVALWGWML